MSDLDKRLERADKRVGRGERPASLESEHERLEIRAAAEHANRCRDREDHPEPLFEIDDGEAGVFSGRDGTEITSRHQIWADECFWQFKDDFGEGGDPRGLLYDPDTQAFYKSKPPYPMVFSRWWCPINRFFWAMGDERAYVSHREDERVEVLDPERAAELLGGEG